jgi:hypothetical protein
MSHYSVGAANNVGYPQNNMQLSMYGAITNGKQCRLFDSLVKKKGT